MTQLTEKNDIDELHSLIEAHVKATDSAIGKKILNDFDSYVPNFKKIIPIDYQKMMVAIGKLEEKGIPLEKAKLEAFYEAKKA